MMPTASRWRRLARKLELCLWLSAAIVLGLILHQHGLPSFLQEDVYALWQMVRQGLSSDNLTGRAILLPSAMAAVCLVWFKLIQPQPTNLSRVVVTLIAAGLTLRYLLWRIVHTLNFDSVLNGSLSLLLLSAELICFTGGTGGSLFAMVRVERSREADRLEPAVLNGEYLPSVDVIVPTYNEPADILRRTVVGCQAIDYPNKRVYLLDDQRRPEIRALAEELGCGYRDRPNNDHAKAGNINQALPSLSGDLVAVFDADYVPSRNFLSRTVGFFQDAKTALVQTPQNFFNDDPITANLGLSGVLNNEQNFFFRYLQPSRDAFNAVVCCGSCFIIRRSALDEIGGIPTDSIAEDMFTSIRLQALGYRIKYLNELLSAGMSAEDTSAYTNQRLRWGRGTLQLMFCNPNPLTTPGLNWGQRLYHGLSILYWVNSVPRFIFLTLPSLCLMFGWTPLRANVTEILYFFLPLYVYNVLSFSWLTGGWRSLFWSDVYDVMLCVPMSRMVFQALTNPFGQGFKVTPKGLDSGQSIRPNWGLIRPLICMFVLIVVALGEFLLNSAWKTSGADTFLVNGAWSIYSLWLIIMASLAAIDVPQRRCPRFAVRRDCELRMGDWSAPGRTVELSESGVQVIVNLPEAAFPSLAQECRVAIAGDQSCPPLNIPVEICWGSIEPTQHDPQSGRQLSPVRFGLQFSTIPLPQYRALIKSLFCQPDQWPDAQAAEYQTAWAFVSSLWRLHPLTGSRGS